tara:strand:+ start:122 stop:361 length:240 start_codon:yes stop_codon:yes gene_type:complete
MNLVEEYPDLLKLDGFDEAIIGVVERIGLQAVCYDRSKVLSILAKEMTEDEALEYFEFNILGSYVGETTPVFLEIMDKS